MTNTLDTKNCPICGHPCFVETNESGVTTHYAPIVWEDEKAMLERLFALNSHQHDHRIHPYTCGNNSSHRPLIACYDGWRCADCDYRQPFRNEAIL